VSLGLAVALLAGVGAVARYVLDSVVQRHHRSTFPLGTMVINISGSFVLGLITGLATHQGLGSRTALIVGIGFCGGFTTFSTWMWESLVLTRANAVRAAAVNMFGTIALGLVAAAAGLGLALL
jgi:fluoride exporter